MLLDIKVRGKLLRFFSLITEREDPPIMAETENERERETERERERERERGREGERERDSERTYN